jgi:hypothetical protein
MFAVENNLVVSQIHMGDLEFPYDPAILPDIYAKDLKAGT